MTKRVILIALALLFSLTVGFVGGLYVYSKRGVPFVARKEQWTVGIYRGESPFDFPASRHRGNPVFSAEDIPDAPAKFVADPFLIHDRDTWYLFFEVFNTRSNHGDIAVATSHNGKNWHYEQIVLDEPFHLAYPYVFKWEDDFYLIPDSFESRDVRLYRASAFPTRWSYVATLVEGEEYVDSSIIYFNDYWWLFVSQTGNDTLRLFYSDALTGAWVEHPQSPIVNGDKNIARPGGRMLIYEGRLYRFTQDSDPTYGNQIWAFEITELTTSTYAEHLAFEDPILKASGSGWNAKAMHTIDPHPFGENDWIAAVDGFGTYLVFGWEY